jgi:hypothetical protein
LRLPRRARLAGIVLFSFSLAAAGAVLAVVATAGLASAAGGARAAVAGPWQLLGATLSSGRNYGPIACATPSRC